MCAVHGGRLAQHHFCRMKLIDMNYETCTQHPLHSYTQVLVSLENGSPFSLSSSMYTIHLHPMSHFLFPIFPRNQMQPDASKL